MPRLTRKLPSLRNHKASKRAVVTLDGRDYYLGAWDIRKDKPSEEARRKYERVIGEWLANRSTAAQRPAATLPPGGQGKGRGAPDLTIAELLNEFWEHAQTHYRDRDGKPTGELTNFKDSIRPLKRLYPDTPARDFGPLMLKRGVRQSMIDSGLSRGVINQRIGRIIHIFKWAVSEELVPAATYQALKTVSGLQRGRTEARETEPVRPVDNARVDAIRPHVAPQVWEMVQLQRFSGMRPGEVVIMRTCDIDTSGDVWLYRPSRHKTAYRGRERIVPLGPTAQMILRPWLKPDDPTAFLFVPREASELRRAERRKARKSKVQPSQRDRSRPGAKRRPGDRYTRASYFNAILRGCALAFPHPTISRIRPKDRTEEQAEELKAWNRAHAWHPNQLRHNFGTEVRKQFGLDAARVILGHSSPVVTEVYAEVDHEKARAVIKNI